MRAASAAFLAVLCCLLAQSTSADETATTFNETESSVYALAYIESQNYPDSSALGWQYDGTGSLVTTWGFSFTVPGIALPANAVITGGTLTLDAYAYDSGWSTTNGYAGSVDGSQGTAPTIFGADGPVYIQFTNFSSVTASFPTISGGSFDLLANGFSDDLMAGDAITVSGYATDVFEPFIYAPGFNAHYFNLVYQYGQYNASGTLTEDYYLTPEPSTTILFASGLLAIGGILRRKSVARSDRVVPSP